MNSLTLRLAETVWFRQKSITPSVEVKQSSAAQPINSNCVTSGERFIFYLIRCLFLVICWSNWSVFTVNAGDQAIWSRLSLSDASNVLAMPWWLPGRRRFLALQSPVSDEDVEPGGLSVSASLKPTAGVWCIFYGFWLQMSQRPHHHRQW